MDYGFCSQIMTHVFRYEMRSIHPANGPIFLIEQIQSNADFCVLRALLDCVVDGECWCGVRNPNAWPATLASYVGIVAAFSRLCSIPGLIGVWNRWCSLIGPCGDAFKIRISTRRVSRMGGKALPRRLVLILAKEEDTGIFLGVSHIQVRIEDTYGALSMASPARSFLR